MFVLHEGVANFHVNMQPCVVWGHDTPSVWSSMLLCPFPDMYNHILIFPLYNNSLRQEQTHTHTASDRSRYSCLCLHRLTRQHTQKLSDTLLHTRTHTQSYGAVGSRLLLKAAQGWWSSSLWDMTDIKTRLESSLCQCLSLCLSVGTEFLQ